MVNRNLLKLPPYRFHKDLVVRIPSRPLSFEISEDRVKGYLEDETIQEALYIASPEFTSQCLKWLRAPEKLSAKKQTRIKHSLIRYLNRLSSRCTPFGLFAGTGMANWSDSDHMLFDQAPYQKHTKIDFHQLYLVVSNILQIPEIKYRLNYFANTSYYYIGNQIRYVEPYLDSNLTRKYQISKVDNSPYLRELLTVSSNGSDFNALVATLTAMGIDASDASNFVDQVIDAQLVVSEFEPNLTGKWYFQRVWNRLIEFQEQEESEVLIQLIDFFQDIQSALDHISEGQGTPLQKYKAFYSVFDKYNLPLDKKFALKTDLEVNFQSSTVNKKYQKSILKAITIFGLLGSGDLSPDLEKFKTKFTLRYGDKLMPLLTVLDNETGIGYGKNTQEVGSLSPILVGINFNPKNKTSLNQSTNWGPIQQYLHDKVLNTLNTGASVLELTDEDLKQLTALKPDISYEKAWETFPNTLAVMFSRCKEDQLLFYDINGASGTNLISRFAYIDPKIQNLTVELAENENITDKISAEIIHLPYTRAANLLARPKIREFEIPFLAHPGTSREKVIKLQDLYIAVEDNRVILVSKQHNKEVIPFLSNTHNYELASLPVYKFLCDLQNQGNITDLGLELSVPLMNMKFLPRIAYQEIILHPQRWNLSKPDYEALLHIPPEAPDITHLIAHWRKQFKIPMKIILENGDNFLLIDFQNRSLTKLFLEELHKQNNLVLSEFLTEIEIDNVKGESRWFSNEFIAFLSKKNSTIVKEEEAPSKFSWNDQVEVEEYFIPGSRWLYIKCYCGFKTADDVLDEFYEIVSALTVNGIAQKWFFVRYGDPEHHLRLRVLLSDESHFSSALEAFNETFKPYVEDGKVSKIVLDTYQRELSRYGNATIGYVETVFHHDSEALFELREAYAENGVNEDQALFFYSIKMAQGIIEMIIPNDLNDRYYLFRNMADSYAEEFAVEKNDLKEISRKYRKNMVFLQHFLFEEEKTPEAFRFIFPIVKNYLRKVGPAIESILENNNLLESYELFTSLIHMSLNRTFPSLQRQHEMLMYFFLEKAHLQELKRVEVL